MTRHTTKRRQSNLELIRILAMLLIAFNHIPQPEFKGIGAQLFSDAFRLWGGVGDCLFFMLSAWFLAMEKPDMRKSFRRAWIFERELLFYSIVLFIVTLVSVRSGLSDFTHSELLGLLFKSLFPFITYLWWYPASYIVFVLILPWLLEGLRALGRDKHQKLALLMLLGFGVISVVPFDKRYSVLLFIYLFILVSYVRWYEVDRLCSVRSALRFLGIGLAAWILNYAFWGVVAESWGNVVQSMISMYTNNPWMFPSVFMAFGAVVLAANVKPFYSSAINWIASCTLPTYLILTYPHARDWLLPVFSAFSNGRSEMVVVALLQLFAIGFYCVALLVDSFRQLLFAVTIDRHKGRWFDMLYDSHMVAAIKRRIMTMGEDGRQ